ncbi:unnamed protein product [Malus baccata var. baccata]
MCPTDAANYIREGCPNQEAIGWQNDCILRYSNRSIYGMMQTNPDFYLKNDANVSTGLDAFTQKTVTGGDLRKFATGNASIPSTDITIYGLVECTPELSEQSCIDFLNYTIGVFGSCCSASIGVRIATPSCGLRLFDEVFPMCAVRRQQMVQLWMPLEGSHREAIFLFCAGKKSNTSRTVIITVVTVVISLVLIISICIYLRVKKMKAKFEGKFRSVNFYFPSNRMTSWNIYC